MEGLDPRLVQGDGVKDEGKARVLELHRDEADPKSDLEEARTRWGRKKKRNGEREEWRSDGGGDGKAGKAKKRNTGRKNGGKMRHTPVGLLGMEREKEHPPV